MKALVHICPAPIKRALPGIMICALILSCCSPKAPEPAGLIRFIDALTEDNIVKSPLQGTSESPEEPDIRYPLQSVPLAEASISVNPLDLKRRLRLGGVERNILFAPPDSEYTFEVILTASSVLEFDVGIIREAGPDGSEDVEGRRKAGVDFRVKLEIQGRELSGQRVAPRRLLEASYRFLYPQAELAIKEILGKNV